MSNNVKLVKYLRQVADSYSEEGKKWQVNHLNV